MRWARVSAGIREAEAIAHFELTEDEFGEWEAVGAEVTARQLEDIAKFYRRSTAVFFLPEAPPIPRLPVDFRAATGISGPLDSGTLVALRQAGRLQRIFIELQVELGEEPQMRLPSLKMTDDPAVAARAIRDALDVTVEDQLSWGRDVGGRALSFWRRAVENRGILVFQDTLSDTQGFSLPGLVPVILLSMYHNTPTRRMFTLFHEVAHLCLGEPGICTPDITGRVRQALPIELFCNAIAGHVLVPTDGLLASKEAAALRADDPDVSKLVNRIARKFNASRAVVVRRLCEAQLISKRAHDELVAHFAATSGHGDDGSGGFSTVPEKRLRRLGGRFIRTVLEAHDRGIATFSDVSDYLGMKVKHIGAMHDLLTAA